MSATQRLMQAFILPLIVPVLVGIGSAAITGMVMTARLEERVAHLESQMLRHEKALDRDISRNESSVSDLARRSDSQDQRLAKLEALVQESQASLGEIRADIKILLRGGT